GWVRGRDHVKVNWPDEVVAAYGSGFDLEDCKAWKVRSAAPAAHAPVSSDVPILILAGQYDPVTPAELGRKLLPHLSHARLVVIPGAGHALARTKCGRALMAQFLTEPTATLDDSCVGETARAFHFQTAE